MDKPKKKTFRQKYTDMVDSATRKISIPSLVSPGEGAKAQYLKGNKPKGASIAPVKHTPAPSVSAAPAKNMGKAAYLESKGGTPWQTKPTKAPKAAPQPKAASVSAPEMPKAPKKTVSNFKKGPSAMPKPAAPVSQEPKKTKRATFGGKNEVGKAAAPKKVASQGNWNTGGQKTVAKNGYQYREVVKKKR